MTSASTPPLQAEEVRKLALKLDPGQTPIKGYGWIRKTEKDPKAHVVNLEELLASGMAPLVVKSVTLNDVADALLNARKKVPGLSLMPVAPTISISVLEYERNHNEPE